MSFAKPQGSAIGRPIPPGLPLIHCENAKWSSHHSVAAGIAGQDGGVWRVNGQAARDNALSLGHSVCVNGPAGRRKCREF